LLFALFPILIYQGLVQEKVYKTRIS